ncbi:MAG: YggS family pyridoxal phosphate-dependent enzyme [Polyangiaceae bacterium]|nr:YggS family pyridoxal phosphate-dependent enzyme [Myxococcales bacterium]MCB9587730.1 YggS family pyridoxal phosphate-dependent enzyme [Polyangiaceae bacterium]
MTDTSVAARLLAVRARVREAAVRAGRDPESVKLLAVSKKQPVSAIREAYALGQRDFGESYAQELATKADELSDLKEIRWHMIGHLQRNKAKLVVPRVVRVCSVDSERLLAELAKQSEACEGAAGRAKTLEVLLEVNLGGEANKSGVSPDALPDLLQAARAYPSLEVRGLMAIPPQTDDPQGARGFFENLRELRDRVGGSRALPELSMGMSGDLEAAVLAGSTEVRVGTAIFGERHG